MRDCRISLIILALLIVTACNDGEETKYKVIYSGERESEEQMDTPVEVKNSITKPATVAIVPKVVNIPYFNAVEKGAMEASKEFGVNVIYTGPNIADSKQQINIIEELIEENIDVLAVSANDPEELLPILNKAQRSGIRVITWDADTETEGREFFINMVHPETLGRHLMDTLAKHTNEKGDYAILTGALSAANLNEWMHWMMAQQEEYYPDLNLIEVIPTDEDPNKAYTSTLELLEKYPNIKGIIGNVSVAPPAASQAVTDTGKIGEVIVVGLSSPSQMREYLNSGAAQVVTLWSPKRLGYLTVALAKNLVEGIKPYDKQYIQGVGPISVMDDEVIMGDPIDFYIGNVDEYDF